MMKKKSLRLLLLLSGVLAISCRTPVGHMPQGDAGKGAAAGNAYARFFELGENFIVSISPGDGFRDTLMLDGALPRGVICMSSTEAAMFSAIGQDKLVTGMSGLKYLNDKTIASHAIEVGHDMDMNYENILGLQAEGRASLVLAYGIEGSRPSYAERLEKAGLRVFCLYDHLEDHPLARSEYIKVVGAVCGRLADACMLFDTVAERYDSLCASQSCIDDSLRCKVLMNAPYGDSWYIPGNQGYMSQLVRDAGGLVLGAREGTALSVSVSIEEAWLLASEADVWLNPGTASSRGEMNAIWPVLSAFPDIPVWNNTARLNSAGGNDFWESGALRPDLILEDLISIFSNPAGNTAGLLNFYRGL
ncbi:MAG: ABC transporter substrate-binding protein [Bacteroidales bacterium]|nr:ABC transporter substrate-binding protein [Bacteroidales bacterium]